MSQLESAKLFDLLSRQIEVADDLIAILDEELAAVMTVDISALMAASRRKQQQVTRMITLDNAIYEVVEAARQSPAPQQAATNVLGQRLPPANPSRAIRLSDLLPQLPPEEGRRLALLKDQVVLRRQTIETRNSTSRRLIQETLGYLDDAIGLITGKIAEEQYRYGGKLREVKGRPPVFISRSV